MKMRLTEKGINLIKEFEGLRLTAYRDSVGVWTIGYGNTFYEDGTTVKQGDKITQERADSLFRSIVDKFADQVRASLINPDRVSDAQFSAMVALAYNIGIGAFRGSTLLRKVNANPCDPTIPDEFPRWNKSGGKVLAGLTRRRKAEAELYKNG
jgi:lysozyme